MRDYIYLINKVWETPKEKMNYWASEQCSHFLEDYDYGYYFKVLYDRYIEVFKDLKMIYNHCRGVFDSETSAIIEKTLKLFFDRKGVKNDNRARTWLTY